MSDVSEIMSMPMALPRTPLPLDMGNHKPRYFPRQRGIGSWDMTCYNAIQEHWGLERSHYAPIMFEWERLNREDPFSQPAIPTDAAFLFSDIVPQPQSTSLSPADNEFTQVRQCNAAFEEDGSMLMKCDSCANARKDCVSVDYRRRVASVVNRTY